MDGVACIGEMRNAYEIEKAEGKRPVGNPEVRWKDNIKINHKEIAV
jgi:hypothetical protein